MKEMIKAQTYTLRGDQGYCDESRHIIVPIVDRCAGLNGTAWLEPLPVTSTEQAQGFGYQRRGNGYRHAIRYDGKPVTRKDLRPGMIMWVSS